MESPGLEEFVEEVDEILQDLEQGILQLEAQPRKKSLVDRIFEICIPSREVQGWLCRQNLRITHISLKTCSTG